MKDKENPTIIFINCVPMTFIFADKVNLDFYENEGFSVELWDLSSLYFSDKQLLAYFSGSAELQYRYKNTKRFINKSDVIAALKLLPKDTIVYHLSRHFQPCLDDFWLLRAFKKLHLSYMVQRIENPFSPSPIDNKKTSLISSLIKKVFPLRQLPSKITKLFTFFRMVSKQFLFNKTDYYALPNFAVGVGKAGRTDCKYLVDRGVEFISIPSPAIDWAAHQPASSESSLILFIDESIGHAPDSKLNDFETTSDLPKYYSNLEHIFDTVEEALNAKVVIGASGKVNYPKNPFSRPIFYKETLHLTSKAKLVIGHSSGALYNAFCWDKPILLVKDDTFTPEKAEHVSTLSHGLGIPYYRNQDIDKRLITTLDSLSNKPLIEHLFCEENVEGNYCELIANRLKGLSFDK